jgi:hypothetical protein
MLMYISSYGFTRLSACSSRYLWHVYLHAPSSKKKRKEKKKKKKRTALSPTAARVLTFLRYAHFLSAIRGIALSRWC